MITKGYTYPQARCRHFRSRSVVVVVHIDVIIVSHRSVVNFNFQHEKALTIIYAVYQREPSGKYSPESYNDPKMILT